MLNQGRNGIDVVLAESLKELAKTRPIDKITIKEITDKAGVIRPTFYNHFQDKYELLEWIVREELIEPTIPFFDNGMVREGMTYVLTAIEKERGFYEKATRLEGQNSFRETLFLSMHELVVMRLDTEKIKEKNKSNYEWLTPEAVADFYTGVFCDMIIRWIVEGMHIPASEMADAMIIFSEVPVEDIMR